jgi:hypothetical protein
VSFIAGILVPDAETVLFRRCEVCGQWMDCRNDADVVSHQHPETAEEPLPAETVKIEP